MRTRLWYARMLLGRGGAGDADRARALLDSALVDAHRLGMAAVAAEIRALAS